MEADWKAVRRWFVGSAGRRLLASEQCHLEPLLQRLPGRRLLQLGRVATTPLRCPVQLEQTVVEFERSCAEGADLIADSSHLPLATGHYAVVILHHSLEFSPTPPALLREAVRVLQDGGHLVVAGFHPWRLHTLLRLLRGSELPLAHPLSPRRLSEWVGLLGLQPLQWVQIAFPSPGGRRLRWLPSHCAWYGSSYILVARKQANGAILLRPQWRLRMAGGRVAAGGGISTAGRLPRERLGDPDETD